MKSLNKNLTNIKNFFELMFTHGNATKEEVYNFLRECLEYVFSQNNLNIDDYDVTFHFVQSDIGQNPDKKLKKSKKQGNALFDGALAYMQADDIDDKKFDVYFPRECASFKIATPPRRKGMECELTRLEYFEKFEPFFEFVFIVLHEFSHIIQYIQNPDMMEKTDKEYNKRVLVESTIMENMPNSRNKRIMLHLLEQQTNASNYVSECEIDANEQATQYNCDMLYELMCANSAPYFVEFLMSNYQFVEHEHRGCKKNEYIFKPQFYAAKARFKQILSDAEMKEEWHYQCLTF